MSSVFLRLAAGLVFVGLTACAGSPVSSSVDPLPSWNAGAAKVSIIDFVSRVTDRGDPEFVGVQDRIAVFDNDGTLMIERPTLVQFEFLYDRIRTLAPEHPEWTTTQPFKAVLEDDREQLTALGYRGRGPIIDAGQGNLFADDFDAAVTRFLATGTHNRFGRRYVDLVYAPMIELVRYLDAHDFRVFVVSGGGIDFIRSYAEVVYSIPRERIIGSSPKTDLRSRDDRSVSIYRKAGLKSPNAGRFKPLNIWLHIGRRPVFAVGNSDGDLDMLRYATDGNLPSLAVLLRHDDAEREYEYSAGAEKVRAAARQLGWVDVSMRRDFATVFDAQTD